MDQGCNSYHEKVALYAKAISHPIRVLIIEMLQKRDFIYSGEMIESLPIARSTLSQHLKDLKEAGLIVGKNEAPKIAYSINKKNLEEAKRLLTTFFE